MRQLEASATFLLSQRASTSTKSARWIHRRPRPPRRTRATTSEAAPTRVLDAVFHRRRLLSLSAAARSATPNDGWPRGLEPHDSGCSPAIADDARAQSRRLRYRRSQRLGRLTPPERRRNLAQTLGDARETLHRDAAASSLRTSPTRRARREPSRSAPPGASAPRPRSPARRRRSRTRTPRANGARRRLAAPRARRARPNF